LYVFVVFVGFGFWMAPGMFFFRLLDGFWLNFGEKKQSKMVSISGFFFD